MRKCVYEGKECLFHGVFQMSEVIEPSPLIGGHPGGMVAGPVAVIERKNGKLHKVRLESVKMIEGEDCGEQ